MGRPARTPPCSRSGRCPSGPASPWPGCGTGAAVRPAPAGAVAERAAAVPGIRLRAARGGAPRPRAGPVAVRGGGACPGRHRAVPADVDLRRAARALSRPAGARHDQDDAAGPDARDRGRVLRPAQRPVLVGCFQQVRFYQAARPRWADLARTAEQTVVFADFGQRRDQPGPLAEIPIAGGSPLRREWTLICDAPDQPACVAAWERPGQEGRRDPDRTFETLWSVDPRWSAAPRASGRAGRRGGFRISARCRPGSARRQAPVRPICPGPTGDWSGPSTTSAGHPPCVDTGEIPALRPPAGHPRL